MYKKIKINLVYNNIQDKLKVVMIHYFKIYKVDVYKTLKIIKYRKL